MSTKATSAAEKKVARAAVMKILQSKPRGSYWVYASVYTCGLIFREAGVPLTDAVKVLTEWGKALVADPERFKNDFPSLAKRPPAHFRHKIPYALLKAYTRDQDKPSVQWFKLLTGETPPKAAFWVDVPAKEEMARLLRK
jgi:hypothetical protein